MLNNHDAVNLADARANRLLSFPILSAGGFSSDSHSTLVFHTYEMQHNVTGLKDTILTV